MITNLSLTNPTPSLARLASLTAAVLAFAMASVANAQQSFKTPEEAADALVSAARTGDRKGVLTVLGRDGADIVSSGDAVADASARNRVIEAYDAKHQVVMEGADKAVLVIGQEDWPFPIPLVRKDGTWRFDTAAGREEILLSPHRPQRAERDPGLSRLCRRAAGICRAGHRRQWRVRTTHRQPAGQEGRSLLAGAIRRGREPARRARRQCRRGGLSRRPAAHALSRLLLQGSHQAGTERARRRAGLRRARQA